MNVPSDIPFQQILAALLDEDTPFNTRYYYRMSDLEEPELSQFAEVWPKVSALRRQAVLDDMDDLGGEDYLLSFEAVGRQALKDSEANVRAAAVRLLSEYESPDLFQSFLGLLTQDPDPEVRSLAATGLGRYVYMGEVEELPGEVLHTLEEALLAVVRGDDSVHIRRKALESLGFSSRKEVPPLIRKAYQSGDKEWVASALYAMGRSADDTWKPLIMDMFISPHPIIREEAARAAGELGMAEARDELLDLIEDGSPDVRDAVIWALSQIGGEGVREALEMAFESAEEDADLTYLELALDNLSFTEDMESFVLLNLPEGFDDDEEDDLDVLLDEDIEEDDLSTDDDEELPF